MRLRAGSATASVAARKPCSESRFTEMRLSTAAEKSWSVWDIVKLLVVGHPGVQYVSAIFSRCFPRELPLSLSALSGPVQIAGDFLEAGALFRREDLHDAVLAGGAVGLHLRFEIVMVGDEVVENGAKLLRLIVGEVQLRAELVERESRSVGQTG